jgi:prepilin-type N-terminal cleavage/methylation domain-containing protein
MMTGTFKYLKFRRSSVTCTDGFSIIEVLIAMSILALAMLAAGTMQYRSIRNNATGNMVTQANMLAKAKMEELKNTPDVSSLTDGSESGVDANGQSGGIYNRSWSITALGALSRRITVTVQWTRRGRTRRIELSSNTRGNGV